MGKMDTTMAKGRSGEKELMGVDKADRASERKEKLVGGVAMGMEDKMGANHQYNTGKTDGICYTKTRSEYR